MFWTQAEYENAYEVVKNFVDQLPEHRRMQNRTMSPVDTAMHRLAWDTIYNVDRARQALATEAQSLSEKLAKVALDVRTVQVGASINSLGEVQGRGGEIDRQTALYDLAQKTLMGVHDLVMALADTGDLDPEP